MVFASRRPTTAGNRKSWLLGAATGRPVVEAHLYVSGTSGALAPSSPRSGPLSLQRLSAYAVGVSIESGGSLLRTRPNERRAAPTSIADGRWACSPLAMVSFPRCTQYGHLIIWGPERLSVALRLWDGLWVVAPARLSESAFLTDCKYNSMRWITRLTRR